MTAHKSDNTWKTVVTANVLQSGKETKNCTVCGEVTATRIIPKFDPILELPGKVKSFDIKKGSIISCTVNMAEGDFLVCCSSSNNKLLAVSYNANGKLRLQAKAAGKVTLSLGLESGIFKKYTVKVVSGDVCVQKVSLDVTSLILVKGKSKTLSVILNPFTSTEKVTFVSSDKKVARVSASGKITAVSPGTAIIYVKVGTFTVKCKVKVI